VEDIFNSPEDLGFSVINVRQMTATWRAPNGQTHVNTLPMFLVTWTKVIISQEIFRLNCLNHIIIRVELYRAQTGCVQCYNCKTSSMSGPVASYPLNVSGVVATCIGNALEGWVQNLCQAAAVAQLAHVLQLIQVPTVLPYIVHYKNNKPYHIQSLQELVLHDAPARHVFCQWILQQFAWNPMLTAKELIDRSGITSFCMWCYPEVPEIY
jgi:hypothetical protein